MTTMKFGYQRDITTSYTTFQEAGVFKETIDSDSPDLREHCTSSNQFSLSSCAGNATADAVEVVDSVAGRPRVELSRLFVYAMARTLHQKLGEDNGTYIATCFDVLSRYGICSEEIWPYDESKVFVSPSLKAMREAAGHRIHSYYKITGGGQDRIDQCISALKSKAPVVFGTLVDKEFVNHVGEGIVGIPKGDIVGGHAMILVGYDAQKKAFILKNSWGCYDEETEVLTSSGWSYFKDLKEGVDLITLNPQTHEIEVQKSSALHCYDYKGELLRFTNQGVDLLVTPNHRMYTSTRHGRSKGDWSIKEANLLASGPKHYAFKKNGAWRKPGLDSVSVGPYKIPAKVWLEFLGYFISEGHTNTRTYFRDRSSTGKGKYKETYRIVGLSQKKQGTCDKMRALLKKLPFQFCELTDSRGVTSFTHTGRSLYEYLKPLGKSFEKSIPRDILENASQEELSVLFEALMDGDGTKGASWTYYTSSKTLADDFQELCLKCGYAADIHCVNRVENKATNTPNYIEWQLGVKRKRVEPESNTPPQIQPYEGKVYCATVPNGILYVRRGGKSVWCGNSEWGMNGFAYISEEYVKWENTWDLWVPFGGYSGDEE